MDRDAVRAFAARVFAMASDAALLALIGAADRAGLLRALAGQPPRRADEIARDAALDPRYVREALSGLAAGGIVRFDPAHETFELPEEAAACLADESSPYFLAGWAQMVGGLYRAVPGVARAFRDGGGVSYAEFGPEMVEGIDRTNAPGTRVLLPRRWIRALPDVEARLETGGRVADVGCGSGAAAIALARRFPRASVYGYDVDLASLERAREAAREAGADNVHFEQVGAEAIPTEPGFDLVTAFDVIHDLAHPREALRRIRLALVPGGTFLMVEPAAGDRLEENLGPQGALLYAMSTLHCLTVSLAHGGEGLGAAWGPKRAEEMCREAGFGHFRRLPIENPVNAFYEVRP